MSKFEELIKKTKTPGRYIKQLTKEKGMNYKELGLLLSLDKNKLYDLLIGDIDINITIAKKLEKIFNIKKEERIGLQKEYKKSFKI